MVSKEWDCGSRTGWEGSLLSPKNGKRGGYPSIAYREGDKSDSVLLTPKNKWVEAIWLKIY